MVKHLYLRLFTPPRDRETELFEFFFHRLFPEIQARLEPPRIGCFEEFEPPPDRDRPLYMFFSGKTNARPFKEILDERADDDPRFDDSLQRLRDWFAVPDFSEDRFSGDYELQLTYANIPGHGQLYDRPMICIFTEIKTDKVDQFETWYRQSYLPRLLPCVPPVAVCRRFRSTDQQGERFFTTYGFQDRTRLDKALRLMDAPYMRRLVEEWNDMAGQCLIRHEMVKTQSIYLQVRDVEP